MRKTVILYVLAAFAALGSAIVLPAQEDPATSCDVKKAGLDPAKFHLYLTEDTPYSAWPRWPGKNAAQGSAPHGPLQATYANPVALRSLEEGSGMAFGSLLVAEDREHDGSLLALNAMLKIKGYNPEAGDWHWFRYDAKGKVLACGRPASCIDCHGTRRENDFIMATPMKK